MIAACSRTWSAVRGCARWGPPARGLGASVTAAIRGELGRAEAEQHLGQQRGEPRLEPAPAAGTAARPTAIRPANTAAASL